MLRLKVIKVVCIAIFTLAFLITSAMHRRLLTNVQGYADGPPAGVSGAPSESNCAICHVSQPNTGPGTFEIVGPSSYEPGKTYKIMVKHTSPENSRRRWGFELTVINLDNQRFGELQSTSSFTGIIVGDAPGGTRQYIEHVSGGTFQGQSGGATWEFDWTAPAEDLGPAVFYAAGNQANNDGTNSGDQIYTTSAFVMSGPPVITTATVEGKRLILTGRNFSPGASLFLNGERQKKTFNDEVDVTTILIGRKVGKQIARGATVMLQVKNADGTVSETFSFTRPS